MSSFKEYLLGELNGASEAMMIEQKLDALFYLRDKHREDRVGMHASAIIVSDADFCYREQVLSLFFKGAEQPISPGLAKIFAAGNSIHAKWQGLFALAGISRGAEMRGYSDEWKLLMTPDDIIELFFKPYVVEIKSVNTYQFKHMTHHPSGGKQCMLYMHFYGIPNGFVLCEDKNTQEIKIFPVQYDPEVVRPYVARLHRVGEYKARFERERKLPKRICVNQNTKRASRCSMCKACFKVERIPR